MQYITIEKAKKAVMNTFYFIAWKAKEQLKFITKQLHFQPMNFSLFRQILHIITKAQPLILGVSTWYTLTVKTQIIFILDTPNKLI